MKFIWILTLLSLSLYARENPFSEVLTEDVFPISTNMPEHLKNLEYESFSLPDSARIIKKVIIEYQNLDGSIDRISSSLNKKIDWHRPIKLTHMKIPLDNSRFITRMKLPFLEVLTKRKQIKLLTKDKLLRNFMLPNPHRIVLDFKGSSETLDRRYKGFFAPFKEVRVGNHKDYYRVVIELDGQYEYQKKSQKHEILLTVK